MSRALTKNILLIGFTSSGKTTTGKVLAERLGAELVDLDDIVEALHVKERGHQRRCRDIFSLYGRECFVGYERAALESLSKSPGRIIALGGGTPVDEENRWRIRRLGTVVYLKARPQAVLDRMKHKGVPQFLGENPTIDVVTEYWQSRHEIYEETADIIIDNTFLTPEETADAVVDRLGARDRVDRRREGGAAAAETEKFESSS